MAARPLDPARSEGEELFFRSLFRGRDDVYPRLFENGGRKGHSPACSNEFVRADECCKKMLTETSAPRPPLAVDSSDRRFPNQHTMPKEGMGGDDRRGLRVTCKMRYAPGLRCLDGTRESSQSTMIAPVPVYHPS